MGLIKLSSITIPDSHLAEDHKELESMKHNASWLKMLLARKLHGIKMIAKFTGADKPINAILKTVKEMEHEDKEAVKKFGKKG